MLELNIHLPVVLRGEKQEREDCDDLWIDGLQIVESVRDWLVVLNKNEYSFTIGDPRHN
jgi:hypothetical protein